MRDGSVQGQPTSAAHGPKRVAQYYMAARKVFKGSKYTIVGLDILDEQNVNKTIKYLKSFLRYASPDPKVIGFHNYSDTNRFSTTRTKRVLADLPRQGVADRDRRHRQARPLVPVQHERARRRRWAACSRWPSRTRASSALYVYQFNPPPDPRRATSTPA